MIIERWSYYTCFIGDLFDCYFFNRLFLGKFFAGTLSGSVAITADAINNLSDASSSVVTLVGFKLASKPADDAHPYGYHRVEYLAGLTVAAMILLIGAELVKSSILRILHPETVAFTALGAAVLLREFLSGRELFGCGIMLCAVILVQLPEGFWKRKIKANNE